MRRLIPRKPSRYVYTLGQKPTFYPEIPLILVVQNCEFCENWDFKNVNFVKIGIL